LRERFDLDIRVVVRTRAQLAAVVKRNPFAKVATNPKLYQVTFLEKAPAADVVRKLEAAAAGKERSCTSDASSTPGTLTASERSKLAALMSGKGLGVTGTARNWTTVTRPARDGGRAVDRLAGCFTAQQYSPHGLGASRSPSSPRKGPR
jgi:uncharacterized protein (DUF1697 family)